MVSTLWTVVGVTATAVLLALVPFAWRRNGPVFGLRLAAVALLPAGFAMTGILLLIGRIGRAVGSFVTHLVFSPVVWFGATMLGVSILLALSAQALRRRGVEPRTAGAGEARRSGSTDTVRGRATTPAIDRSRRSPATDDEFADIEELLRRRGIK